MIITISREFASGGSEVAQLVADRLGWSLVDNQLVVEVAARAGLTPEEVAQREESTPGFGERVARALAISMPEFVGPGAGALSTLPEVGLVRVTEAVVAELAARGRVVMVGRAAPAVLASHPQALHIRIVAPRAARVARAVERLGIGPGEAEALLDRSDENRGRYHRQHYNRDWADPVNYHMVLNSGALGVEGAVQAVLARARALWGIDKP